MNDKTDALMISDGHERRWPMKPELRGHNESNGLRGQWRRTEGSMTLTNWRSELKVNASNELKVNESNELKANESNEKANELNELKGQWIERI